MRLVRVCLLCTEMFGVGHFGGFGRATRMIGRELARRGVAVTAVVPRRSTDWPVEFELDGIRVVQVPPGSPTRTIRRLRDVQADLFHSQEPSTLTYLAQKAQPDRPSVVTFRDPLDRSGWWGELRRSSSKVGVLLYAAYIDNPLVRRAVRRATRHFCAAQFVGAIAQQKFRLQEQPTFLPSPIEVPAEAHKAELPTVCFVGRWHPRKRPELFFELARKMPSVRFIAVGAAQDPDRDRRLRAACADVPNLEFPGVIDQFTSGELQQILSESWVLVNCSHREGLPTAFAEAAAHGCAILACLDPDGFVSRFGRRVEADALQEGLEFLLEQDRWRALGEAGRAHVGAVFAAPESVSRHLDEYHAVLREVQEREELGGA